MPDIDLYMRVRSIVNTDKNGNQNYYLSLYDE